jgi:hypothetical protein
MIVFSFCIIWLLLKIIITNNPYNSISLKKKSRGRGRGRVHLN